MAIRKAFSIFVIAFIFVAIFTPFIASAVIIPEGGIVPCEGLDCQFCHLAKLGQNLFNTIIYLATFIAVLLFLWAGIKYITAGGNPSQISQAHSIFGNVLIGFILLLVAWFIVDLIMTTFLSKEYKQWGVWNEIQCVPQFEGESDDSEESGIVVGPPGTSRPTASGKATQKLSESDAYKYLEGTGVQVDPRISQLRGVRQATLDQVIELKKACGCIVVITSTTGGSHSTTGFTHGDGWKVDLRSEREGENLRKWIEANFERAGARTGAHGGPRFLDPCKNEYVYENQGGDVPPHLDVRVTEGVCQL